MVVLVLLNVLIAIVVEVYSSVEPEVLRKVKQIDLTKQLSLIVQDAEGGK